MDIKMDRIEWGGVDFGEPKNLLYSSLSLKLSLLASNPYLSQENYLASGNVTKSVGQ